MTSVDHIKMDIKRGFDMFPLKQDKLCPWRDVFVNRWLKKKEQFCEKRDVWQLIVPTTAAATTTSVF